MPSAGRVRKLMLPFPLLLNGSCVIETLDMGAGLRKHWWVQRWEGLCSIAMHGDAIHTLSRHSVVGGCRANCSCLAIGFWG